MTLKNSTILQTQPNFRDLGGLPARDGRVVRKGLVFRSGDLHGIGDEDVKLLGQLGISTIIDFRASRELEKRPNATIPGVKEIIHLPIYDAGRETTADLFDRGDAGGLRRVLVDDYRRMIREHTAEYRKFFEVMAANGSEPLMFHCAAGKDRTGLAAWFFLSALGVDQEVVRKNYLESNEYTWLMAEKIERKLNEKGLNGAILRPLLEVRPEYIDAALDEINLQAGNLQAFLEKTLGALPGRLQEIYLTDRND